MLCLRLMLHLTMHVKELEKCRAKCVAALRVKQCLLWNTCCMDGATTGTAATLGVLHGQAYMRWSGTHRHCTWWQRPEDIQTHMMALVVAGGGP